MGGDRQGYAGKQHAKLQILVLHGSRQDGEVFSQRLKTLTKKLKNIAVSKEVLNQPRPKLSRSVGCIPTDMANPAPA
jgi:hypothetical protein